MTQAQVPVRAVGSEPLTIEDVLRLARGEAVPVLDPDPAYRERLRRSAEHVRRAVELLRRPILYDVDIPYLFDFPDELAPKTAGMKETLYSVSETGLSLWQDAIAAYTSQIEMLFEGEEAMREKIKQYWAENSGIRLWSFA